MDVKMTKFEKVKELLKTMDYELKGCFVEYLELDINIEKNYKKIQGCIKNISLDKLVTK